MESNDTNITELLDESYYNDIFSDILLVATYLKIFLLLVTIPTTVIPAVVVIHIIKSYTPGITGFLLTC